MKKQLKHYRIVTDQGDCLLIRRESMHCLLQSLERLASGAPRPAQPRTPRQTQKQS